MLVMGFASRFAIVLAFAAAAAASPVCRKASLSDSVLHMPDSCPSLDSPPQAPFDSIGVVEGNEAALHRALNLVHRNKGSYVALLFYASWCPFSKVCRPNFIMLSSLFPSIRHFAFEESVIRPSILSRYGVHGFPTLFLLNSSIRVRYHGPRTINSLSNFYNDVTGVNPAYLDPMSVEAMVGPSDDVNLEKGATQENFPFSWVRLTEELLQQDAYLALASCFVLMRLLYFLLPKLSACVMRAWRRQIRYASLVNLWDCLHGHVEQAKRGFSRLNPRKRSNLQEGAISARAWASKSLASVSLGEPSTGRVYTRSER